MVGTPVPEAAVDEYRNLGLGEGHVDAPPSVAWNWDLHTEAHPCRVQGTPEVHFRLGPVSGERAELGRDLRIGGALTRGFLPHRPMVPRRSWTTVAC